MIEEYVISRDALDRLRAHANRARPGGWEVGGQMVSEWDRLISYQPLKNIAKEPGWFELERVPLAPFVVVHTHPERYHAGPSEGDIGWMKHFVRPLGIYAPPIDKLVVWRLDPSRPSGVRPIQVVPEPRPRARARPTRRPGRRT